MVDRSRRCPRCGSDRLVQRMPRGILMVCPGCGLVSNELEPALFTPRLFGSHVVPPGGLCQRSLGLNLRPDSWPGVRL